MEGIVVAVWWEMKVIEKDILFIFGSPRSGTTYTNSLLRDYFDFGLCSEGQWVLPIGYRAKRFGDLSVDANLHRLIAESRKDYMFHHFRTIVAKRLGRPVDITSEDIYENLLERSFPGVVYAIFLTVAQQMGKKRVGNKCPGYWEDLPSLLRWFPKAKFLHVLRDGRDVAMSLKGFDWGEKTTYGAGKMWGRVQSAVAEFEPIVPSGQFFCLRYEQLLRDPSVVVPQLELFLGGSYRAEQREKLYRDIEANPMRNNFEKWRTQMSDRDQIDFEFAAGHWLRSKGYDVRFENPAVSLFRGFRLHCVEIFGRLLRAFRAACGIKR